MTQHCRERYEQECEGQGANLGHRHPGIELICLCLLSLRKCQEEDYREGREPSPQADDAEVAVEDVEETSLDLVRAAAQIPEIETESQVRDDHEKKAEENGK